MKKIKQTYKINASVPTVWKALTDPNIITKWSGGMTKMSEKESSTFSLWGGDIYGKNTKIIKHIFLEQDWWQKGWTNRSQVTFSLKESNGQTVLALVHENIPDKDFNAIASGWKEYYMTPLINFVEHI